MALPFKVNETWHLLETTIPHEPSVGLAVMVFEAGNGLPLAFGAGAGALPTAFRDACTRPLAGRPRRPTRLQVETVAQQQALKGVMPGVEVVIVERPASIVAALAQLAQEVAKPSADMTSWGLDRETLIAILRTGKALEEVAPWDYLDDTPITVASQAHGINEGVVVVIGQSGQQYGFVFFDSFDDYLRHARFAATARQGITWQPVAYQVFDLVAARELPKRQARAASDLIGKRKRYAHLARATTACELAPTNPAETHALIAMGQALVALVRAGGDELRLRQSIDFEHEGVLLMLDGVDAGEGPSEPVEHELSGAIVNWCDTQGGAFAQHMDELLENCESDTHEALLVWPAVAHDEVDGRTILAHFREANALSAEDEALIAAQAQSWTGYWEVLEVELGVGVLVRDAVTETTLWVADVAASYAAAVHMWVCARVISDASKTLYDGIHPRALGTEAAHRALSAARVELGWPATQPVSAEQARDPNAQRCLIAAWDAEQERVRRDREGKQSMEDVVAQQPPAAPTENSPEAQAAIRAYKTKHYERWLDQPLPALQGRTPRAAVKTKAGKADVERLLTDMESLESRLHPAERYDVTILRRALRL